MIFCTSINVSAHEIFWSNKNIDFANISKIIIFPLINSSNTRFDSYIQERLSKKFSKINFVPASKYQNLEVPDNFHESLLQSLQTNQTFAGVENPNLADMYIVPILVENRIQEDISPQKEFDIEIKSWIEDRGGRHGDSIYDERTYTFYHVIPEKIVKLNIMQVEFVGFDKKGQILFTSLHQDMSYVYSGENQFKRLVNNFQKAFEDAFKSKKLQKGTISFLIQPVLIEGENSDDIFFTNAIDSEFKTEALKRIKKINIVEDSSTPINYQIRNHITKFTLSPHWYEPSYTVTDKLIDSQSEKWKDRDNKEHTRTVSYYTQEIEDNYAYWGFSWIIEGTFELLSPEGNVLLIENYREHDDKPIDAYRHVAEKFCKKVNKFLKQ